MERLTIDEIIAHCKRKTEKIEKLMSIAELEARDMEELFMKEYWEHRQVAEWLEELKRYKDAEENGMLIHLPCRVGDTVYRIWNCGKSGRSIAEFKIEHVDIDNYPQIEFSYRCTKGSHSFYPYRFCKIEDFGKTVFLTREAAEQALAQMKGV